MNVTLRIRRLSVIRAQVSETTAVVNFTEVNGPALGVKRYYKPVYQVHIASTSVHIIS